jgi:hypothetical protein
LRPSAIVAVEVGATQIATDPPGKPVFVDTSVIIAASISEHPSHAAARDAIDRLGP